MRAEEKQREAHRAARGQPHGRHKKKRRLSRGGRLLVAVIVVLALLAGVGAGVWLVLPVGSVAVEGKTPYTTAKILQVSGLAAGDRLFGVDQKKTARLLQTNLPYISSATVSWRFPNVLVVHLTKAVPAAAVARKSGYAVLDKSGKVLETPANLKAFSGLAVVAGPDTGTLTPGQTLAAAAKAKLSTAISLLASIKAAGISSVTSVNVLDSYQIQFGYQNRITVVIGTSADFDEKLRFAAYMLTKQLQSTEKGTLDVSEAAQDNKAVFSPSS